MNTGSLISEASWRHKITAMLELAKIKVVALIAFTAWAGMLLASPPFQADIPLMIWSLLGISLAAASGAAINHLLDERFDEKMQRTKARPLPTARVSEKEVLAIALVWMLMAMAILLYFVNWLTALLTFFALVGYAIVYTVYLKHNTPQNIVWGGAAGAAPPLLGWVAMTGQVTWEGFILFLIIFIWTPPHFWPLAIHRLEDYKRAGIPMLPVVRGVPHTKFQVLLYTLVLTSVTLLPTTIGMSGMTYLSIALLLNLGFVYYAFKLYREPDHQSAMGTFGFSILYLTLLFAGLILDHYVKAWV
ncbi:MAG: protoheme IX farnesyltransferase [Gammaproteobacteria bacterium]|nr:protoheme IX farnesyltransferase [Gammaproteobacteria bacterium]